MSDLPPYACGTTAHLSRRTLLATAGLSGLAWLTPIGHLLAQQSPKLRRGRPPQSVILLWLGGGPSQLETFDPHPGTTIAAGTGAIQTRARGIQLATRLERLADQMDVVALIRNVVSLEGDHERATFHVKTGYRPDPTLVHPSLGAIVCHQLAVGATEIPRHISIFPNKWYGRGGYLGEKFDAFRAESIRGTLPDVTPRVSGERFGQRIEDLEVLERSFGEGRLEALEDRRTLHRATMESARQMMASEQLAAFDVRQEADDVHADFGDSEFGRGCLAALRLIEVGVRCVEVTLEGWDSHINNHDIHARLIAQLDPAFAGLLKHLRKRDRLQDTIVICGGEFGRTPKINPAGGRDHWPHGFSLALAGGSLRGGVAIGETDPAGGRLSPDDNTAVADVHATVLSALGIDPCYEIETPIGRPMKLSSGSVIQALR